MTNLSTEHTLIAAIPILVVLAVLSAAIIVFPKVNLDDRSRASDPLASQVLPQQKLDVPTTIEPSITPYTFPKTSE
ncbi:hypothetical protein KKG65_03190 [Patescibacteria group bacterium]|nr:hypothetical protein [Patescibacteria group bacterium]